MTLMPFVPKQQMASSFSLYKATHWSFCIYDAGQCPLFLLHNGLCNSIPWLLSSSKHHLLPFTCYLPSHSQPTNLPNPVQQSQWETTPPKPPQTPRPPKPLTAASRAFGSVSHRPPMCQTMIEQSVSGSARHADAGAWTQPWDFSSHPRRRLSAL